MTSTASPAIQGAINQLTGEIAFRQDTIKMLQRLNVPLPEPAPPVALEAARRGKGLKPIRAPKAGGVKIKRPYTKRGEVAAATAPKKETPPPSSVTEKLDKPDTLAGAMKLLLRGEETFTNQELRDNLLEDADYKALLEAAVGEKQYANALNYWLASGRLNKAGRAGDATYTVTATGKGFFTA